MVVFENSGHVPYIEEPEAFFEAVRGWLHRG
jgi:pimeloyl-ACP methyl ester carboxylesterase